MAGVFLDANRYIDLMQKRDAAVADSLHGHTLFISPLSTHILFYAYKLKIPNKRFAAVQKQFNIVNLSDGILDKALKGPTEDLEDNIQLHSAAQSDCDYFLTHDKNLLKLKFFGKAQIIKEGYD